MDMDTLTEEALRGSIRKWEAIWKGDGEDLRDGNCPLCRRYNSNCCTNPDLVPTLCPVARRAETFGCEDTPWEDWMHYMTSFFPARTRVFDAKSRELAKAELDFLVSLLPD